MLCSRHSLFASLLFFDFFVLGNLRNYVLRKFHVIRYEHEPWLFSYETKGWWDQRNSLAIHFPPSNCCKYPATWNFRDTLALSLCPATYSSYIKENKNLDPCNNNRPFLSHKLPWKCRMIFYHTLSEGLHVQCVSSKMKFFSWYFAI